MEVDLERRVFEPKADEITGIVRISCCLYVTFCGGDDDGDDLVIYM
jgi:hypothetical protein